MTKLFKFEWRKLWQQKSFYICFGVGLIMSLLVIILARVVVGAFGGTFQDASAVDFMMSAVAGSGLIDLLGIYLAIFACHDYNQHTIKNLYARGYSRSSVFFTKYLVSLGVTLVMGLVYMLFAFLCCLAFGGRVGTMTGTMWATLALQLWILVGVHGLYFGISMMIGKIGGAVALNIVGVSVIFSILELILQICRIDFDIISFNFDNLILLFNGETITQSMCLKGILLPLAYAGIFVGLGYYFNYRRDV